MKPVSNKIHQKFHMFILFLDGTELSARLDKYIPDYGVMFRIRNELESLSNERDIYYEKH